MTDKGVDRKCRSEACGRWSVFPQDDPAAECTFCGERYGHITLGMDVIRHGTTSKYPAGKADKAQLQVTKLAAPKRGEFGARR